MTDHFAHVTVDGIPVGDGYGIEIERPEPETNFLPRARGEIALGGAKLARIYLTRLCAFGPRRLREVPPTAVISISRGNKTYVFYQGWI